MFVGHRSRRLLALLGAAVTVAACQARPPDRVEWRGYDFQEVRSLSELPASLRTELGAGRAGLDGIADRGRPFNVTDVVDSKLPMRRFLTAGRDGDTWLVAQERGGRAHYLEVFLFLANERVPKLRWVLAAEAKTLREVVRLLSQRG